MDTQRYIKHLESNGIVRDDTQALLVNIAKKACRNMTLGSLFEILKVVEKCCDEVCPEWRNLER